MPWQLWLAGWTALTGAGVWAAQSVWLSFKADAGRHAEVLKLGWDKVENRDQQIDRLRRLLDRSRRRENAYATAFELVLLAMKLPEDEQAAVIARAREILETALGGGASGV